MCSDARTPAARFTPGMENVDLPETIKRERRPAHERTVSLFLFPFRD
jgi:hypothetical protein